MGCEQLGISEKAMGHGDDGLSLFSLTHVNATVKGVRSTSHVPGTVFGPTAASPSYFCH